MRTSGPGLFFWGSFYCISNFFIYNRSIQVSICHLVTYSIYVILHSCVFCICISTLSNLLVYNCSYYFLISLYISMSLVQIFLTPFISDFNNLRPLFSSFQLKFCSLYCYFQKNNFFLSFLYYFLFSILFSFTLILLFTFLTCLGLSCSFLQSQRKGFIFNISIYSCTFPSNYVLSAPYRLIACCVFIYIHLKVFSKSVLISLTCQLATYCLVSTEE